MNPRVVPILIIFLLLMVSVNAFTVIDDFEDNDITDWNDLGGVGSNSTSAAQVWEGAFSMLMTGGDTQAAKDVNIQLDENYSFKVYTTLVDESGSIIGLWQQATGYSCIIRQRDDGGNIKYQPYVSGAYANLDGTNPTILTNTWYTIIHKKKTTGKCDTYLYDSIGTTMLGYKLDYTSFGNNPNAITIWGDSVSGDTYTDYIDWGSAPGSSVTASFNSFEDKYYGQLELTDTSTTVDVIIDDWDWFIDTVKQSDDQNYNFSVTESTDYNVCLFVEDSTNTYNDITCSNISTSDWKPLINWKDTNGSWLKGTVNLDFNILAVGQATSGIKIYWGLGAYDFNHLIVNDTNLFNATEIVCDDYNFQDNTSCYYSFNTSTIADGNYFWDLNIYNNFGDENASVNMFADNTAPILTFDLNYISGFTTTLDVNFYLNCNDALSTSNRYLLYLNDVNVNDTWETNDTNKDLTNEILNGNNDTNAFCYDLAGNYSNDINTSVVYALWFDLINEDTGEQITNLLTDVNVLEAKVFTYDGNINLDLNGLFPKWYVGNSQVLRFDFTYNDDVETKISREMDFSLLTDANANICVAPFQTLYEQIFVSSTTRSVVVYNDFAKCFNLASKTKFAYENALMVKGYTIQKPYYLYTWYGGVKILLALLDGSTASIMNLDTLIFNINEYEIDIATDTVGISPKLNTITGEYDTNTIEIYYKSLRGLNDSVNFKIYNDENLLFNYTETLEPNEILIEFYYFGMDINADNVLKIEVTKTVDGETSLLTKYFYISGSSYAGTLNPILALIVAFVLMFVAITFVAYRYALGWFGILIGIVAIGVLTMATGVWYIRFAQAIILIIIVFIVLIFKNETQGLN